MSDRSLHRVFVSYHHANDQYYRDCLVRFGEENDIFINWSVDTGDISDQLSDEQIRAKIRDEYLQGSTVTIMLVGKESKNRKHVDWEIYSSMYDGKVNKRSGILVINLPGISEGPVFIPHRDSGLSKVHYRRRFPEMPSRIIDNLAAPKVKISVVPWARISENLLRRWIEVAYRNRAQNKYDLSSPMRRINS